MGKGVKYRALLISVIIIMGFGGFYFSYFSVYSVNSGDDVDDTSTEEISSEISSDESSSASSVQSAVGSVPSSQASITNNASRIPDNTVSSYAEDKYYTQSRIQPDSSQWAEILDSGFTWTNSMEFILNNAANWVKNNTASKWHLISLGIAGTGADVAATERILLDVQERKGLYNQGKDLAIDIMSVTFSGASAVSFRQINLIDCLGAYSQTDVNDPEVLALFILALDSNDYQLSENMKNTRETMVQSLCSYQKADGSISKSKDKNIYSTSLALAALSQYQKDSKVRSVTENGLEYLSACIKTAEIEHIEDAEIFLSENLANVIIALSSLKVDLNEIKFMFTENNLVELLIEQSTPEGGFRNSSDGSIDIYVTEQALIALLAVKNGDSPYITKNEITGSEILHSDEKVQPSMGRNAWIIVIIISASALFALIFLLRKINLSKKNAMSVLDSAGIDDLKNDSICEDIRT